jgi:3-hydroxy-9,10-secoandrosta-1,3,5(10)-triene-9,17-dione monooxygenase
VNEETILAAVDQILPGIAERSAEDDRCGQVSEETIRAIELTGAFATLAPRRLGGHELGLSTFSRIIRKISAVSPSVGWVTSFLMGASWRLLAFGETAQQEMFKDRGFVLGAGTAAPITGVERVDGGYRLTGKTAWNSGSPHAEWFQMNGLINEQEGPPTLMIFALPREDVTIHDTWHILGMKATASRDISVEGCFVPLHRAAPFRPALEGQSAGHRLHDNTLYHIPFLAFAMIEVLPVVVGAHRGAAEALRRRVEARMATFTGSRVKDNVVAQIRMAQASARAAMAEQMLAAMIADICEIERTGTAPIDRARIKLHASMVTDFCLSSLGEMARSVGGDGFRDESDFQRYFRDINTVARHAFLDPDTAAETFGKLSLGLPAADPLI